ALVDSSGLAFGRWHTQAPYMPQCGAIAATPHAGRLSALPEREQYAAMELWRGTIAAHTGVLHHGGAPAPSSSLRFDYDRWPRFVPIRLPHAICVQERLPPGAAAVLLNRSHRHHDLLVPLDGLEKRIFDAIDGRRSIADIAKEAGADTTARARALF